MRKTTEKQLIPELKRSIKACGSLARWAREHGYSRQFVIDVRDGKKPMPDGMCKALKILRMVQVNYYWIDED